MKSTITAKIEYVDFNLPDSNQRTLCTAESYLGLNINYIFL